MIVYVASPLGAKTQDGIDFNIRKAIEYGDFVKKEGHKPIIPHLLAWILDDLNKHDRNCGIQIDLQILFPLADEIWVFGGKISEGMQKEINLAKKLNVPVKYWNCDIYGRMFQIVV